MATPTPLPTGELLAFLSAHANNPPYIPERDDDLLDGQLAELRHQVDPQDAAFSRLACDHPEACSCAADYPTWTPGGQQ